MCPHTIASADSPVPIGVLVVDDQLAVREGLKRLIAAGPIALRFISTAATGYEALSAATRLRPDVVVLDADLAGEDGLAIITQLTPIASVVVLTSHGDLATRARAKSLGAAAFVEKHQPAADLLHAITVVSVLRQRGDKPPGTVGTSSQRNMAPSSDVQTQYGH